jgi:hypothetical protein
MKIYEGLHYGDLDGLIKSTASIDQYKPKIGTDADTVVFALTVDYDKPAEDLSNFISSSDLEHLDVEASNVPNEEGKYKVFVEFARTPNVYNKILKLIKDINNITNYKLTDWKFVTYKMENEVDLTLENLQKYIISTAEEYDNKFKIKKEQEEKQKIKERIEFLIKY